MRIAPSPTAFRRAFLLIAAVLLLAPPARAQDNDSVPFPPGMDCWSWSGDVRERFCAPIGPYQEQCEFRMADDWRNPQSLLAFCDGALLQLALPCNGAIFFVPGRPVASGRPSVPSKLECRPAPKGLKLTRPPRPALEPIPGCTRLRLVKNGLEAQCRRRDGSVHPAFVPLPCAGRIVNDNGRLLCVDRPR